MPTTPHTTTDDDDITPDVVRLQMSLPFDFEIEIGAHHVKMIDRERDNS